ncbi:hypothetical protein [Pelagibacterium sp.]|uniref:hypothetical protein n=1 Tax=Pelagibacterium sp. TaxID=1967288 RepID=UPI003A8EA4A4
MSEIDLRTLLVTDPALSALVPASNIRINFIQQGAQGVVLAIYRISGAPGYTMQGDDGLVESRYQIDIRGKDTEGYPGSGWSAALPVATRLKALLSGYRGTVGSTDFRMISILSERQRSEKTGTDMYHTFSFDFQIWHRAS